MSAIKLSKRHNVAAFCEPNNARYALGGVRIGPTYVEATDGNCLIRAKLDEPSNGQCGAILDGRAVATIKGDCTLVSEAAGAADGDGSFVNADGVRVRFNLESTEKKTKAIVRRETPALEGRFPRTDEIFPKGEPDTVVEFDAALLKRFCDYAVANRVCDKATIKISLRTAAGVKVNTWPEIEVWNGEETIAHGLLGNVNRP